MRRRSGGTTVAADERQRSPTQISPDSGGRNPATSRKVVVLPQPEGPSSEKNSPRRISNETASTAVTGPKRLVTWRNSTLDTERKRTDGAAAA